MSSRMAALLLAASLATTAAGGFLASEAINAAAQDPIKTVTIDAGEKGRPRTARS